MGDIFRHKAICPWVLDRDGLGVARTTYLSNGGTTLAFGSS
jgi:hypothetical protein